jgi:hypothetical protein
LVRGHSHNVTSITFSGKKDARLFTDTLRCIGTFAGISEMFDVFVVTSLDVAAWCAVRAMVALPVIAA